MYVLLDLRTTQKAFKIVWHKTRKENDTLQNLHLLFTLQANHTRNNTILKSNRTTEEINDTIQTSS